MKRAAEKVLLAVLASFLFSGCQSQAQRPASSQNVSLNQSVENQKPSQVVVGNSDLLNNLTDYLQAKGYRAENERLENEDGMSAQDMKAVIEFEGRHDWKVYEFQSDNLAQGNFANVLDWLTAYKSGKKTIELQENLITVTDKKDGETEYFCLFRGLIIETDDPNALSMLQDLNFIGQVK